MNTDETQRNGKHSNKQLQVQIKETNQILYPTEKTIPHIDRLLNWGIKIPDVN